MPSLWGEEFEIANNDSKIIEKISKPKKAPKKERSVESTIKSKTVSIADKLILIKAEVERILGVYKENTQVIKTKEDLVKYIDAAIANGIIDIDTETNNSLDPLTCKLMGPCLYTPGQKNAYIPINHTDLDHNRLEWQLTEEDVREQLQRVMDANVFVIMHNGKFDYEVIKCTTGVSCRLDWDTMIAARLLDENELAGLKPQYLNKIDPSIEKYSIDHLFTVPYEYVDPDIFALYAATDSFMTHRLFEWQYEQFQKPENQKIYKLFKEVEMPIVLICADMELTGISLDLEYAERLSKKYNEKLVESNAAVANELAKYNDIIANWRNTNEANTHPFKDSKPQKSKNEQLKNPPELTSPTQLAILLYDILKLPVVDKSTPRGTGTEILEVLAKSNKLCDLILEQRQLLKLIDAFIDTLPKQLNPSDNRLHSHFNQLGTATGRFSCTDPNLQQIPSHNKEVRMLFCGSEKEVEKEFEDYLEIYKSYDIKMNDGTFKRAEKIVVGDVLENDNIVSKIEDNNKYVKIYC